MSMVLSHGKSKKAKMQMERTFTGEDLGTDLIEYLGRQDRPADDEVEKLIELAHQSRQSDVRDEMGKLIRDTNTAWDFRMVYTPTRTPEGAATVVLRHATNRPPGDNPEFNRQFNRQLLAWNQTMVLHERGLLDRVRKCAHCGNLFFARFSHSEYHSDECRIAAEVANPIYRERRAEYMRKQRKDAKKGKR